MEKLRTINTSGDMGEIKTFLKRTHRKENTNLT